MTITVRYTCKVCDVVDRPVLVPPRGPENVIDWLQQTSGFVSRDHRAYRPQCQGFTFDLKIPFESTEQRVGELRTQ